MMSGPSPRRPVRLLIADDHAIFREGLQLLLGRQPEWQVVGEVGRLEPLKDLVRETAPDLLLIDYHMPGGDASALVAYLKQRYPELKVVVLTGIRTASVLQQLVEVKADAVLLKEACGAELLEHLRTVLAGQRVIPPPVQALLEQADHPLTRREFQILKLICDGLTTQAIADHLALSVGTVHKHRENLQRKLEVRNVAQLIRKAQAMGWLGSA